MWYETPVRLSGGRVLLRAALLWAGGGWALWWAWRSHGRAQALQGAGRALYDRLALVYALVGALAVLTGLVAALAARPHPRRHTLRLGEPSAGGGPSAEPPRGPAAR